MTARAPLTRTEKILLLAIAVSLAVAILVPLGFKLSIDSQQAKADDDLQERRVESCLAYNTDQTNDRNTAIDGLRQFAIVFLGVTPEEADDELASQHGREFVAYIHRENPFRTCTPACVDAEFDPDIPNCGPAKTADGRP